MKLNTKRGRALALAGLLGSLAAVGRAQTTYTFGFESDTVGAAPAASGPVTFTVSGDTSVQSTDSGTSLGLAAFPSSGSQYLLMTTLDSSSMPFATSGAGATDINTLWASAYGAQPNTLSSTLNLVTASALQITVNLNAGSTLSLQAQMLTSEPTNLSLSPNNDAAFIASSVNGGAVSLTTLASVYGSSFTANDPSVNAFDSASSVLDYSYTAATAGTYTFLLGVGDAASANVQSGLVIDNLAIVAAAVPEPASAALVTGGAILALGVFRHRRRRAA